MKPPHKDSGVEVHVLLDWFLEKVENKGMVVQWSPQEQVLAHLSVASFVTHCGWNSSMEALTLGMPLVAFPQWGDQVTNARYLVDVFKVAVRMYRGEATNKLIKRDEIKVFAGGNRWPQGGGDEAKCVEVEGSSRSGGGGRWFF